VDVTPACARKGYGLTFIGAGLPPGNASVRYFLSLVRGAELHSRRRALQRREPSLTRSIKQLERNSADPMFNRERPTTNLSELAATLKPYLEKVYPRAEDGNARRRRSSLRLPKNPLRLG